MRKCKIIISYPTSVSNILIDEEKKLCSFDGKAIATNIQLLFSEIEDILSSWNPNEPTPKCLIVDGVEIEVYFKNEDETHKYLFNPLIAPKICNKLYTILERLNG